MSENPHADLADFLAEERAKARLAGFQEAAGEIERLRETLDLIANSGMDARQCMLTARAALKP